MNQDLLPSIEESCVAIIGLGYVGLPLAIELSKPKIKELVKDRKIIGFDINQNRIAELKNNFDKTNEIVSSEIINSKGLEFTYDTKILKEADIFIITVPTPITEDKIPNLEPLIDATKTVAIVIKDRDRKCLPIIIYESTVYPGTTEEICVPILEKYSELKFNEDFFCGYSPERINPGDNNYKLTNIVKITSGSNLKVSKWIDDFYAEIINAGTFLCSSIKIAEAAKIIENTQRDLNIALINELAIIFNKLNIDTLDVLEAASTKWNFLNFKPGLVGGHCIGVDPYYLTFKSKQLGYQPEVVLAGRKINDGMSIWIVDQVILNMIKKNIDIRNSKILILGFSFKENCSDLRNTKVFEMFKRLKEYKLNLTIMDPLVNKIEAKEHYDIEISNDLPKKEKFDVVIVAVAHKIFTEISQSKWLGLCKDNSLIYDLKGIVPRALDPLRL